MSLPQFTAFLKAQKLSQKTIRNYHSDASQFLNWSKISDIYDLTSDIFIAYTYHLQSQSVPRSTLARHLASLRQFARFLNLPVNLDNPPLPLIPTILKNFRFHLTKNRYKHKTVANYLSDIRHYLNWYESR
ncbi:MAG: hypothetical protein A2784_01475 [Candidatus Chisholmbacteria bacterium RIFCSPHIGHO2_01_FULL_48_12]|uniref:Core-binding (CB) domain-containing protein n=1 Tax=Candidatus Chisholmbacteria bacterium RIFCSPHIGHO2_01_FULL_48_12 TaxID=1797589 RepID=A0A1G1VPI1_9BACT|nr:MAG: hypothetical protein A2784_01475 [Candidatus Chisholmbacteria bacterium RIFCSPHIGHO2_01_FULL_48_12]